MPEKKYCMSQANEATSPAIEPGWKEVLKEEFAKPYFSELKEFLKQEKQEGHTIYPPGSQIFSAYDHCPFDKVKVVILGQDPYHGARQANGLCFSVHKNIRKPPSLDNIFKEIKNDLGHPVPSHGDLSQWAEQGVFLLNAILTVRAGKAGSHQNQGWEQFTNQTIKLLSDKHVGLVFLLWGNFAKNKADLIDQSRHYILTSSHPSPYSANNGFLGSKHFSKTNELLKSMGKEPVDWKIK